MGPPAGEINDDLTRVNECLQGEAEALAWLRERCHTSLVNILVSRGASPTEADDLLADLWADCVPGGDDKPSLLEKFGGKCKLLGWLSTVATRRWIDFKRRQVRHVTPGDPDEAGDWPPGDLAQPPIPGGDALVGILRQSLEGAFARCSPEALVLLRLRYVYELSQRELARMLGRHESKVSRLLSQSMAEIETHTLAEVRKHDHWLQLTWDDFMDLCSSVETEIL
jgi:RNA polymerase sigma factor (sigma-70 family)